MPGEMQAALFELPPEPSTDTYPTTVYRLLVPPTKDGLVDGLDLPYLREKGFEPEERTVAGVPALLVQGVVLREEAEWCDVVAKLTGQEMALGYSSGGAALLLAVDDHVYALTYGTLGRFMIDIEKADPVFGISFAVRALAPAEIRQVRRRVMGTGGRVDRSFVPGGQPIRMYGIDKWSEIVGQVCGRTTNPKLTEYRRTGKPARVEGSNALHIPLGVEPERLIADLREINRVCERESPLADLEFITQIRPVPASDPRLPVVVDQLNEQLGQEDPRDIALAVPQNLIDEIEQVRSYRIRIPKSGRRPSVHSELDLGALLAHTRQTPPEQRWECLHNGRIFRYADAAGKEEIGSTSAARWLTAQLAHEDSHLLLVEGVWYEIGNRHREFLREEIAQILAASSSIVLPPWPLDEHEGDYNKRAARQDKRLVLLDQKLLRTNQHHRGIEACDLLGPDGELIHVKRADRSSLLSHLFVQGVVAADALQYDQSARAAARDGRPSAPLPSGQRQFQSPQGRLRHLAGLRGSAHRRLAVHRRPGCALQGNEDATERRHSGRGHQYPHGLTPELDHRGYGDQRQGSDHAPARDETDHEGERDEQQENQSETIHRSGTDRLCCG